MAKEENKEIKKAMEIIDEMSMDEREWELYESRRLAIMDYNTGMLEAREEGIEKGERKKQIEVAKEMLKKGIDIEEITEITKLEKEEIQKILETMEERYRELYESRRLAIMDYNTGMLEAREEGERKSKIKIAKKLLAKKVLIEEIMEITELTKEEIEQLKS